MNALGDDDDGDDDDNDDNDDDDDNDDKDRRWFSGRAITRVCSRPFDS